MSTRNSLVMPRAEEKDVLVCEPEFMIAYSGLGAISTRITYMLDKKVTEPIDPERIKSAAEAVARKWRLWAGRASLDGSGPTVRRTIRIPLGDLPADYKLVDFVSLTRDSACSTRIPALSRTSCASLPGPDPALCSTASSVHVFDAVAKAQAPLVNIVVTTFADVQTIGISINHIAADGKGVGMWSRALNAELNNMPWVAPALDKSSRFNAAVAIAREKLKHSPEAGAEACVGKGGVWNGAKLPTAGLMVQLIPEMTWEKARHGLSNEALFIGEDVAAWLVSKVKKQVHDLTDGKEYVSSYDVLAAWIVKASYSAEPKHGQVKVSGAMCLREELSQASGIDLVSAPLPLCSIGVYNQPWPSPYSSSLAELALFHRRGLIHQRSIPQLVSADAYLRSFHSQAKPAPLHFALGKDAFWITNQSQTGLTTSLDWGHGAGQKQYVAVDIPEGQRIAMLNKVEEGFTWAASMRPSRWKAAKRELGKLQAQYEVERTGKTG